MTYGLTAFMDQYLDARRDTIFKQVHTLIYIFDVVSTSPTDMVYFLDILGALRAGSGPSGTPNSESSADSTSSGPMVHVLVSIQFLITTLPAICGTDEIHHHETIDT